MSDVIRVGVVAEGPSDHAILEEVIGFLLGYIEMEYTALQPEISEAFGPTESEYGFGWGGVFKWARGIREEGRGAISGSIVSNTFDVVVVHIDCDVAAKSYNDIGEVWEVDDLPCALPCPPSTATVERLEEVLLGWLGETEPPEFLALCIPAQSIESWIVKTIYPNDVASIANLTDCLPDPTARLGAKPKDGRFVSSGRKNTPIYRSRAREVASRWEVLVEASESAARFDTYLARAQAR